MENQLLAHLDLEKNGLRDEIDEAIEHNRKGDAALRVVDAQHKPLPGAKITLRQTRHDFLFGCNAFMVGSLETEALNHAYEERFAQVFNMATIPFFWKTDEPRPGAWRFAEGSEAIYRRPPQDRLVAFCRKYRITPKGHHLLWHRTDLVLPEWLPEDKKTIDPYIQNRFETIAARYADLIDIWDVVNESLARGPFDEMPQDYVFQAFERANILFPHSMLLANETTQYSWEAFSFDTSAYYYYLQALLARGMRLDGIGMQFHFPYNPADLLSHRNRLIDAKHLLKVLRQYALLNKPIHITEVTVPSYDDVDGSEELQARLVDNLYRLWFSAKNVGAVVWWNLPDGYSYVQDPAKAAPFSYFRHGGLLTHEMEPKPVYRAIDALVNREWNTWATGQTDRDGQWSHRSFYGTYELIVEANGITKKTEYQFKPGGGRQEIEILFA